MNVRNPLSVLTMVLLFAASNAGAQTLTLPSRLREHMSANERRAFDLYLAHRHDAAQKGAATAERLIAMYYANGAPGGNMATQDSATYKYSGTRGVNPALSFMTIDNMRMEALFDTGVNYHWNSVGSLYAADKRVSKTFDAANRPATYIYQQFSAGAWTNRLRGAYTYNAQGRDSIYRTDGWNGNTQTWEPSYRHIYTYNASGDVTRELGQVYSSANNTWDDDLQLVYTYNAAGALTSFEEDNWNNAWVPSFQDVYTYTPAGKFSSLTSRNWDATTGAWVNAYRDLSFYNAGNNEVATERQFDYGSGWEGVDSTSHVSLNGAGMPLLDSGFSKINGAWQFSNRVTTTYTSGNLQSTILKERWFNNTLENYYREFSFYDAAGYITRHFNQYWHSGAWTADANTSEQRYYYESYTTTGIYSLTEKAVMNAVLSPVPAGNTLRLSALIARSAPVKLTICDGAGRLLRQWAQPVTANQLQADINVADLPAGTYFLRLSAAEGNWTGMFSVQH